MISKYPITLNIPNKLVYSGHLYAWQTNATNFDEFKKIFFNTQTFVRALSVPFLLGQYGDNSQDSYWKWLMQYLK